jgi:hypothetical protein
MNDSDREDVELLLATLREGDPDVDLVPGVLDRIRHTDTPASARLHRGRRRRTAAIVAVAALGLAACAAIPPVREAVVALFSVNGILVRNGGPTPSPSPASSGKVPSTSIPAVYSGLGDRITLAEATAGSNGRLLLPSALGEPDDVFRRGVVVSLGYGGEAPDWLVMEVLEPSSVLFEKIVLTGGHVKRLTVNGNPGVWVEGPQELVYVGTDRQPQVENARLSANTLIWEQDGVSIRIETPHGLEDALRVAASMLVAHP